MTLNVTPELLANTELPRYSADSKLGLLSVSVRCWLTRKKWPLAMACAMVGVGLAFMLGWNLVVHHSSSWNTGGDLWGIFRGAHFVGWGFPGGIYDPSNGVITFPGMPVLLAPVAMLSSSLHLTESFLPITLAHPTAALLLEPIELLLTSTVVFAADELANRLSVPQSRRIALCVLVAVIAWPTAAVWGHAEDVLATTFAIYALIALLDQKWPKCGWLFGVGIVIQPLVALILPLVIGATPSERRLKLTARSTVLSIVLISVAFIGNASDTFRALVKQPTPPSINHATPWVALAPKLPTASSQAAQGAGLDPHLVHSRFTVATSAVHPAALVAGGPGRSIDLVIALLFGIYVWRRPQHTVRFLWLAALVLASRCAFEAVMTPYYIAPPLVLGLVLVSRQSAKRFYAAAVIALESTVFAYYHLSPWVWWLPIVVGVGGILALGYPSDHSSKSESPVEPNADPAEFDPAVELRAGQSLRTRAVGAPV